MKIGIIGCGRVAVDRHLPALKSLKSARIVALADKDARRLEYAAEKYKIEKQHLDYTKMLLDPEIETVGVLVPLESHFEIATAVLEAKKHLLLEKPMCRTLDEADRLIEQAARTDRRAMVAFNRRFHRLMRRAKQIIQVNRLGPVRLINVASSSGQDFRNVPAWRLSRRNGGGCLIEDASHFYDLWRFLLEDEIVEVFAASNNVNGSDDEPAVVSARTANGVLLNCALSDFSPHRHEMEIFGDGCVLSLSPHRFEGIELTPRGACAGDIASRIKRVATLLGELPRGLFQYRYGGDYDASFRAQWQHFIECIQDGKQVGCTLEDGRRALEIALAAVESASVKKSVAVAKGPRSR